VQRDAIIRTLRLASFGIVLGLWIASLLYGTTATDPATFAGMILLLVAVEFLAGYFPARRASRINPMIVLRSN
jgi:ABC-type antimicrobial peptide transport system permease subunit